MHCYVMGFDALLLRVHNSIGSWIFVGNLLFDVDSENLGRIFDQAGVVEIAEVRKFLILRNFFLHIHLICVLLATIS